MGFRYFDAQAVVDNGLDQDKEYITTPGSERIDLVDNDLNPKVLGYCELLYIKDPFEFYYLGWLVTRVPNKDRAPGQLSIGEQVLDKANDFIDSRGAAGILCNTISENIPVHSIYQRHGWVALNTSHNSKDRLWMSRNLPAQASPEIMSKAIEYIKKVDPYFQKGH